MLRPFLPGDLSRRRATWAAAVLAVLVLGGCTTTGGTAVVGSTSASLTRQSVTEPSDAVITTPSSPSSSTPAQSDTASSGTAPTASASFPPPVVGGAEALLWTQQASPPLGQPVPAGSGVAVYVLHDGALAFEVVDAATGRIRWQQPAATGAVAPGVEINPVVIRGRVVYLRPVGGSLERTTIVVADAATGADVAVSTAYRIEDRPTACQNLICFVAYAGPVEQALQMDPATGVVTPAGSGAAGRQIGPEGLRSIQSESAPEQLARVVAGATVWSTPLSTVFGAGYSSNGGWDFHSLPAQSLLIGSVGRFDPANTAPTQIRVGMDLEMAGIDVRTGARRWLQTGGVEYECVPQAAVAEGGSLVDVRCRWGAASVAQRVGHGLILRTATLSLEGFNPTTGATTWHVPLADPTGQSPQAVFQQIRVVGEDTLLVAGAQGAELIDPATGTARPAPADTQAVCVSSIVTSLTGGQRTIHGTTVNQYETGAKATACDQTGTALAVPRSAWPSWIGATVGQVHVVATRSGVQGYRQ